MSDIEDDLKNPYYVDMMKGPRGKFGAYFIERTYDAGMDSVIGILSGTARDTTRRRLSRRLKSLTPAQRRAVTDLVQRVLITAVHGFLHGLSNDQERIRLEFEGCDVDRDSDGLHGELFWWLRDLARHPVDLLDP